MLTQSSATLRASIFMLVSLLSLDYVPIELGVGVGLPTVPIPRLYIKAVGQCLVCGTVLKAQLVFDSELMNISYSR